MPRKQPTLGTTNVAPLPTSFHEVLPGFKLKPNVFPLSFTLPNPNARRSQLMISYHLNVAMQNLYEQATLGNVVDDVVLQQEPKNTSNTFVFARLYEGRCTTSSVTTCGQEESGRTSKGLCRNGYEHKHRAARI